MGSWEIGRRVPQQDGRAWRMRYSDHSRIGISQPQHYGIVHVTPTQKNGDSGFQGLGESKGIDTKVPDELATEMHSQPLRSTSLTEVGRTQRLGASMELGHWGDHLVAGTRSGAEEEPPTHPRSQAGRQHAKPERKRGQTL